MKRINYDSLYKDLVLDLIEVRCPNKIKTRFTSSYFYDIICFTLHHLTKWSSLKYILADQSENHHDYIRKMHLKWAKHKIFEDAYYQLLNVSGYVDYLHDNNCRNIKLFIDSTKFFNKNGSECIGRNTEYLKKKITKIAFIGDKNQIILGSIDVNATSNDSKHIEQSINNLYQKLDIKKKIILIGDKGYIRKIEDVKKIEEIYNVKLTTPLRKNQKNRKLTRRDKEHLKDRSVIEYSIKNIKQNSKVCVRNDRKILPFNSLIFLSMGLFFVDKYLK